MVTGRNVAKSVKIPLCAPLFLGGPANISLPNIYSFLHATRKSTLSYGVSYSCEVPPFSLEVSGPILFLVQDDTYTSFSPTIFRTHVYGLPVCTSLNFGFLLLVICFMSVWFLDQLEEPWGVEEISSSLRLSFSIQHAVPDLSPQLQISQPAFK